MIRNGRGSTSPLCGAGASPDANPVHLAFMTVVAA
jgi:hypothetical protein